MFSVFQKEYAVFAAVFALCFFVLPVAAKGQIGIQGLGDSITLTMTPEFPRPFEEVAFTARGFSVDLARSHISWFVDGTLAAQGRGLRTFSLSAGAPGSSSRVTMRVQSTTEGTFQETVFIRPAEVDILWEADTYIPPFYKGKRLPSSEETITLIAVPSFFNGNGKAYDPEELVYTWREGGRILIEQSGYGKRAITIQGPRLYQRSIISVEAATLDERVRARETIALRPALPEILFYEKHPLRGILYGHALVRSFTLNQDELVVRAEPYFFPREAFDSLLLDFEWTVNNRAISPLKRNELVLLKEKGRSGTSRVRLKTRSPKNLMQAASSFLIRY